MTRKLISFCISISKSWKNAVIFFWISTKNKISNKNTLFTRRLRPIVDFCRLEDEKLLTPAPN